MKALYVTLCFVIATVIADEVPVITKVGTFVGFGDEIDISGTPFRLSKFLGIPYAEAPVGNLRFRKPVPKAALNKPLEVKHHGSACMHATVIPNAKREASEDCLFLNVYSPEKSPGSTEKYPVMLWIYGGGFMFGSANAYIPDRLVANGPVVAVTINYRVSLWGFLSTTDENSPGNYGLWDQHLAIKWVHDNIDAFGGDPNAVTIFGESAGAASVIYQGWYPGNVGLFQRIIAQSGSAFTPGTTSPTPLSDAKTMADLTGCKNEDNGQMVECLRGVDNHILNTTLNDFSNGLVVKPMTFIPVIDNDFVPECKDEQTYSACRSTFSNFDLMTGATSGEGYMFVPPLWDREAQNNFLPNRTYFKETLIPQFLQIIYGTPPEVLVESTVGAYTDWNDPENPRVIREKYCDLARDFYFLMPALRTVELHSKVTSLSSTFMYYLTQEPDKHIQTTPTWAKRPNHGDDILYVFGGEGDLSDIGISDVPELTDWEKEFADDVMTLFTNFAKTGNPNKPRDLGIDWLPYTSAHGHYLDMSRNMAPHNVKTRLEACAFNFWSKIVPAIQAECMGTVPPKQETCAKGGD